MNQESVQGLQQQPGVPQVVYVQPQTERKSGCAKFAAVVGVISLGLIVVMCGLPLYFVGKDQQEQREAINERVEKGLIDAREYYERGNLEEAVRVLEPLVDDMEVRWVAERYGELERLHAQYGREYGERFTEQAATYLAMARDAIANADAEEANRHLTAGLALRYAPSIEDIRALKSRLEEAQSERKMTEFVRGMSDAEFEAFRASLAVPNRTIYQDTGLNTIFFDTLKLNRDKAIVWRERPQSGGRLPATGGGKLTLDNFERIRDGMTLAEVEALLGRGALQASGSSGGFTIETYGWGEGIPNASVTFSNGRVQAKAQIGLR